MKITFFRQICMIPFNNYNQILNFTDNTHNGRACTLAVALTVANRIKPLPLKPTISNQFNHSDRLRCYALLGVEFIFQLLFS